MRRLLSPTLVSVLLTGCLLAGCSGSGQPLPGAKANVGADSRQDSASWREAPDTAKAGGYVSQTNGADQSVAFGFRSGNEKDRGPACTIGGVNGITGTLGSDPAGNVYVPDAVASTVTEYAPNCGAVVGSFGDPYGSPIGALPSANAIYVPSRTNVAACSMAGCTSDLTDPSLFEITSAAVDSSGNVWAAYYSSKGTISLIVWRGGVMPGRAVSGYINSNAPGGILFDKHDRLISIMAPFATAYVYRCSAKRAACTNTGQGTLRGGSNFGALNARNNEIQVTDHTNASVDVYAYPSFTYKYSYHRGLVSGYAVMGITQTQ
jgi:hypothetical protein